MERIGHNSLLFHNVFLHSPSVVTGPLEKEGPLGKYFDYSFEDTHCYQDSWEKAEMSLVQKACELSLSKEGVVFDNIDFVFGGDLNNQIAITSYALKNTFLPYLGTFAACSTLTENLILGSIFISGKIAKKVMCITSSHNATSERQFRYPTEYGGQKPLSMTFTTTAAGACIISPEKSYIKITEATIGKIIDVGLKDAQDMGRTMAPAAVVTFLNHLQNFNHTIDDYDLIVTGDLSTYGSDIFEKCLKERGINIKNKHFDAGILLYDGKTQNVFSGGSGCGCVTAVVLGYLVNLLKEKKYQKILILATGALLNPIMTAQKETIPCISHGVVLERVQS